MKIETVDHAAFSDIRLSVLTDPHLRDGIGTYKEKKLHLILKRYFIREAENREVPFRGYVCDGKTGDLITEIMTSTLHGLSDKLSAFLPDNRVNVVFPLIAEKRLYWIDPSSGETSGGKLSPRKDGLPRLLSELVYILGHLSSPNLTVTAVFIRADEYRVLDGRGPEKKIGAQKIDKIPAEIQKVVSFDLNTDIGLFLPDGLKDEFTRTDFGKAAKLSGRRLSGAMKVLERAGVIRDTGKSSRPKIYYAGPQRP